MAIEKVRNQEVSQQERRGFIALLAATLAMLANLIGNFALTWPKGIKMVVFR